MICTHRGDRNVRRIADQLRRFRFFPLIGQGNGLRRPVHAEDLAIAIGQILDHPGTAGELTTWVVARFWPFMTWSPASAQMELRSNSFGFLYRLPSRAFTSGISVSTRYRGIPTGSLQRIEDLVCDNFSAETDFNYRPRSFQPPFIHSLHGLSPPQRTH